MLLLRRQVPTVNGLWRQLLTCQVPIQESRCSYWFVLVLERGRSAQCICDAAFSLTRFVILALCSWSAFMLSTLSALRWSCPCSFFFYPYLQARNPQLGLFRGGEGRGVDVAPPHGAECGGRGLRPWERPIGVYLPPPRCSSRPRLAAEIPATPSPPAAPRLHLALPSPLLPFRIVSLPPKPIPLLGPPIPASFAALFHAASLRSYTFPTRCRTPLAPPLLRFQADTHTFTTLTSPPRPCYTATHT